MKSKLVLIIKLGVFGIISFIILNAGLYIYAYLSPKLDLNSANKITIYDNNGVKALENIDGSKWVRYEDISKNIIDATVATEDKNFWKHKGFDYLRIIKAVGSNLKNNSLNQGASTISQQYIKNLFLTFDKTWRRKIEEAFLTFQLEVHYNKKNILEGYLNTINYGGVYGVENASNYYFNKKAKDLSIEEATILVGIPKNPSLYNPITHYDSSKKRQWAVIVSMKNNNYIKKDMAKDIYKRKLNFVGEKNLSNDNTKYYMDAVISELKSIKQIPESLIKTGGLKIYTNLDINAQKKLEDIVKEEMNGSNEELQVGVMSVIPSNGKVTAVIGGRDYSSSEYNRVTQAKRQVGSTIKPLLYYAALENGFSATSTFSSQATSFTVNNNKSYSPKNYGDKYANGLITMAAAIAYSDNIYAVKTHLFLGQDVLVDVAKRAGITTELDENPSLALGTTEINMLDFSNAYVTLANEGIKNNSYFITKVTDSKDNVLYEYKYKEEKVLNNKYLFILNELLTNTYNYSFVDYTTPTMLSIKDMMSRKYAIKSGSTNTDYWTIGYNKDLLVMAWNGYDDNKIVQINESKINKRIWIRTMEAMLEGKGNNWYSIPEGINASLANPINGEVKSTNKMTMFYYIKGTEPTLSTEVFNDIFLSKKEN
ncbi:MAG: transglycosylase domain-containing protein [Bacilli bacterium]